MRDRNPNSHSVLSDREISGIKPSISIIIDSLDPSERKPIKCLGDTGCDLTPIDISLVKSLGIQTFPIAANEPKSFHLANNESAPRLGRTAALPITVLFLSGDADIISIQPIKLSFQFELLEGVHGGKADDHWILFGKDLINLVSLKLNERGINPINLWHYFVEEPTRTPAINPAHSAEAKSHVRRKKSKSRNSNSIRLSRLLISSAVETKLISPDAANSDSNNFDSTSISENLSENIEEAPDPETIKITQESGDLRPFKSQVFTDDEKEAEYRPLREKILRDPEILEELQKNALIDSPCTYPEAKIALKLTDDYQNKWWKLSRRQYNTAQVKHKAIDDQIKDWLDRKKIRIAPSGSENINNPLLAVPKVSGGQTIPGQYRICIDPRILNSWLKTDDKFDIPLIRKALEKFSRKLIFGELDLAEAFLQFPLDEESCKLLSFTWGGVQYQFICMPFGVKFMTSFCHRIISQIFSDLNFVDPYVDNLPFAAESWDEHRNQLLAIIRRCNQWNLKIKQTGPLKVGHSTMQCLGHIVTEAGVKIDPRKLKSIEDWPFPQTGAQMSSFLGFAGFIQQHVRHYSELAAPFNEVKNQKEIIWSDEMKQEFLILKRAILDSPMLIYPNFSKNFCIASDASNTGCGGVLYQPKSADDLDISSDSIVAICSHKWTEAQRNYSAYKKELYGLVYCLRKFHEYIWGRPDTIVFTDHKPLTFLFSQENLPVPLQQFVDHILDYSFEIHHRPGILNVLPDALSRMYERLYSNPTWGVPPSIRFSADLMKEFASSPDEFDDKGRPNLRRMQLRSSNENNSESKDLTESELKGFLLMEGERRGKRIIEDESIQQEIIREEHRLGHFGRDAIYSKLYSERGIWWPNMRQRIHNEIAKCNACARFVVAKHGFKPADYIISKGIWSHIQIDCASFPESEEGFNTLLVAIDVFSGFILLFPMIGQEAKTVAKNLWSAFSLFGLPEILQSDNGPEFRSKIIAELTELMKITHRFIVPYNPRCDGKVERAIETIKSIIKKLLQGADIHWPKFIPFAQFSFNNKISSLTNSTPFSLMFGRQARPLSDSESGSEPMTEEEWKEFQDKINRIVYPAILDRTKRKKIKMVEKLNENQRQLRPDEFPDGSKVMIIDPTRKDKNQAIYVGPYEVIAKDLNKNLVLKEDHENGKLLNRRVTPDQAKHYLPDPDASPVFEVENILDHKRENNINFYLTHWKGYSSADATWEPENNFLDTKIIREFHSGRRKKK